MLTSCVTREALAWGRDEVTVDDGRLRVKNARSVSDGEYSIAVPKTWSEQRVVEARDGVLEVSPPMSVALDPGFSCRAIPFRPLDLRDAHARYAPIDAYTAEFAASIERRGHRVFRVHVFGGDRDRERWVRIGTIDIGPGTQWPIRKPLSWVAVPLAVPLDVVGLAMISGSVVLYFAFFGQPYCGTL
jgi:hypothetical protein